MNLLKETFSTLKFFPYNEKNGLDLEKREDFKVVAKYWFSDLLPGTLLFRIYLNGLEHSETYDLEYYSDYDSMFSEEGNPKLIWTRFFFSDLKRKCKNYGTNRADNIVKTKAIYWNGKEIVDYYKWIEKDHLENMITPQSVY